MSNHQHAPTMARHMRGQRRTATCHAITRFIAMLILVTITAAAPTHLNQQQPEDAHTNTRNDNHTHNTTTHVSDARMVPFVTFAVPSLDSSSIRSLQLHQSQSGTAAVRHSRLASLSDSSSSSVDPSPSKSPPSGSVSRVPVPVHLSSPLANDTCTLTSHPNGTALILSCPGCTLYVPLTHTEFDVEMFFSKAINYAYFCSALTVVQIYFIFKQMKSSESPAAAGRLSRYTVGMHGLIDGYQSMFHLLIAFSCEALFNAFIVTSLLQFVACVLFEMAFLQHLYRVAYPDQFNAGWEQSRRARRLVDFKFYTCMMGGLILFYVLPHGFTIAHIVLYGFWVPQIIWQAIHGFRRGFGMRYIIAMSITRLILPMYFLACPVNFLHHPTDFGKMSGLIAWIAIQVAILITQKKIGPRFFVPKAVRKDTPNTGEEQHTKYSRARSQP